MIKKITLANVASFHEATSLETDKKVNLIYGLNATGKSTLSNYLYASDNATFSDCSIEGLNDEEILVYNQKFIKDYFYEDGNLKGIFSLSKENKDAEEKIKEIAIVINSLKDNKDSKRKDIDKIDQQFLSTKQRAMDKIWEIKTSYTGGDRVLEYCFDGLKKEKEKLFDYIINIEKPKEKPLKSVEQLKEDIQAISGENAAEYHPLENINFKGSDIESDDLYKKVIIGNENSTVSQAIANLGNSDWVNQGLSYLPDEDNEKTEICPFCQKKTITSDFRIELNKYFDESYSQDIEGLKVLLRKYQGAKNEIPSKSQYTEHPVLKNKKDEFEKEYDRFTALVESNLEKIEGKIVKPSMAIELISTQSVLEKLENLILLARNEIEVFNKKIRERDKELEEIRIMFWNIMRWEYDQTIETYTIEYNEFDRKKNLINNELEELDKKIKENNEIISEQQNKTVNIETAITNIKNALINLGLDSFAIEKVKDSKHLYQIVRPSGENTEVFHSLSEGEKMLISFLYFIELCKGKKSVSDTHRKKIIVIDDPISSLSHVYVFNVAQMIQGRFTDSKIFEKPDCNIEQTFILTHSLYFYYELTDLNKDRRNKNQKLFRLTKEPSGSKICDLKYEHICNDYHSYWSIVTDENQNPALIANCMRNIIEYFFGFVEKRNFKDVFDKESLKENKFQAFYRYMNRESHSCGQNVFDYKEFNYSDFKDALRLVFVENGYPDHYEKMIRI